jgi:RHS repeat-associated protein
MSKVSVARFFLLWGLLLALGSATRAQVATGTPPFGSFGGGPDVINLGNLNSHITVPVINKPGRQMPFNYNLTYDSSVWYPVTSGSTTTWQPVNNWGWGVQTAVATGYASYSVATTDCYTSGTVTGTQNIYSQWSYTDKFGVTHPFSGSSEVQTGTCGSTITNMNALATDGSGYTLQTTSGNESVTLISRGGKTVNPPVLSKSGAALAEDTNGNEISVSATGVFTDTLGLTALTVSQHAPGPSYPTTFSYTAPSGATAVYTMKYASFNIQTNFGCSGTGEYSAGGVSLVSEIDLPDQSINPNDKYTFTYEQTPGHSGDYTGRLASVTLPTGGTISYLYTGSNNGIECSDGSAAGLTRTTPDGEWQYARSGSGTAWTTTVSDPSSPSNQTVINFQSVATAGTPTAFFETERQVYQGSTSGTLLKTTYTCYSGGYPIANCNSTAITLPISERSTLLKWPVTGGLESGTVTNYNKYGNLVDKIEYGYGSGAVGPIVRSTTITYGTYELIVDKPNFVEVQDHNGNELAAASYSYDGTAVTTTSGTPQHDHYYDGARGNLTNAYYTVSTGTSGYALAKVYSYYDTGNINVATDVNNAITTYTYGTGSCGNSFATSVSEPLSLSRSMIWNCTGGVETSVTDENSQTASITYHDAYFWRPNASTDQESNVTNMTYTALTSVEAALNFSSSTSDVLANLDDLGRTHVSQLREAPGSSTFDSVETDYDSLGRPSKTSLPYSGTAGQTDSSGPGTTITYDALSRKSQVTDSETPARTVTFTYAQNDTYRTLGPAPAGENTKRKQFEYDALGRLTSVCEITSATGSGTCGQTSPATGYWTTYTYDVNNNVTGVKQNAQSTGSQQTRTYVYDDLSRMTSETNPESGTTTYTYDTDTTCGTSKGDLVKKIDAVGDTICYVYDALHRPTSITVASGTYASSTPIKKLVYDSATVNGVVMSNVKSRLAEAYTCTGTCTSKITDVGFSYTVRGEPSDVYESTPHSGGYFHTSASYWPNGALDALTAKYGSAAITGLPNFTYAPDGEGRISTVSASAGQNPVTATAYSVASLATQVTFGSSDTDSFTYDPNSNRMTKYTFKVNGQSLIGTLTWNSIGTLESLAITDPFFGSGNQTCNYTHDDISRIASANCGSPLSQTFSYDAFSNISKSGTVSFQPTYSYLTNRMTQVGSSTPTYDANGNATNDTLHTYAWDAAGRPVTADTVGLTYDALGRMVEQNRSGVYSQIVYTPVGTKFAIMNGSTLTKAFVPLTGGSQAVYNSSGLAYYRHSDWVGSSRFASTPARAMYYDGAYAPFGEAYAQTGTADLSFTGMNQDTVANLYDFPAREYNNIHGRWPSPDPAGKMSAHIKDPQTWNRYAYVRNSPLQFIDPTGMDLSDCDSDGSCSGEGGNGGDYNGEDGGGDPPDPCASNPSSCAPPGGGDCGLACPTDPNAPPPDPGQTDPCTGNPGACDAPDPCLNPWAGTCASATGGFQSLLAGNGADSDGDPCVYLNASGTGIEKNGVDNNSSATECKNTGGVWVPIGGSISISSDGTNITVCNDAPCISPFAQQALGQAGTIASGYLSCLGSSVGNGVISGAAVGFAAGSKFGFVGGAAGGALSGAFTGYVWGGIKGVFTCNL